MGVVINFPAPDKTKLATRYDEPAKVIVLPVLRIPKFERTAKTNLPVPIGGPQCKS